MERERGREGRRRRGRRRRKKPGEAKGKTQMGGPPGSPYGYYVTAIEWNTGFHWVVFTWAP